WTSGMWRSAVGATAPCGCATPAIATLPCPVCNCPTGNSAKWASSRNTADSAIHPGHTLGKASALKAAQGASGGVLSRSDRRDGELGQMGFIKEDGGFRNPPGAYSGEGISFEIGPRGERWLLVAFRPTQQGEVSGALRILSNANGGSGQMEIRAAGVGGFEPD